MNIDLINEEVASRYISANRHPTMPYTIYNYTEKTQFDGHWNEATLECRGLILSDDGEIIARPFKKFFSIEQLGGKFPDGPFAVYEKLDGSLGILYWREDGPALSTRGSFVSDQAIKGTEILRKKYGRALFNRHQTYLFEIIYPENRIVVDYGDMEDIILLAVIDNDTGVDLPLPDIGIPVVKRFDGFHDFAEVCEMQRENAEGFVALFWNGERVKIKHEEYKRLHRILTVVNARHIWDALRNGDDLTPFIDKVPEEYHDWFRAVEGELTSAYRAVELHCQSDFQNLGDRAKTAEYFKTCRYPHVLFRMLDGKDYSGAIWKLLRPEASRPFREDRDA